MSIRIAVPQDRIEAFCSRWQIRSLALFGSVLRDDFGPGSDVDVLVGLDPQGGHSLFDMVGMRDELREIFGTGVDLVSRRAIEASRNPIPRRDIQDPAVTLYAA